MNHFKQADFFSWNDLVNTKSPVVGFLKNRLGDSVEVMIEKEEENSIYINLLTDKPDTVRKNLAALIEEFDAEGASDPADEMEDGMYFALPNSMSLRIIAKAMHDAGWSSFEAKFGLAAYDGIFLFDGQLDTIHTCGVSL